MSKQKKNVYSEFLQDDFVPSKNQQVVKYLQGRGNNLHCVEDYKGQEFLVSMPKKFRQTVWLRKGDCLAIDPVLEGNKVKGEIICVFPVDNIVQLIKENKWPLQDTQEDSNSAKIEDIKDTHSIKNELLAFFQKNMQQSTEPEDSMMPSSSEEETESESDEEEEEK